MSEESQYSEHPGGWIQWFCALEDHQFLCELDEDFVKDSFNQYGLKQRFNYFNEALDMICSQEMPDGPDLEDERFLEVYQEATDIYGLLHARFLTTTKGLALMREHLLQGKFGQCPRVLCEKQHVIPIGLCEDLKTARVKVYCPRCEEVYVPKKKCADVDGAYFGKSFPQLLLMTHPDIAPKFQLLPDTQIMSSFEPTVFGFKVAGKKGSALQGKCLEEKLVESSPNITTQPLQQIDNTQLSQSTEQTTEQSNKKQQKKNKRKNK